MMELHCGDSAEVMTRMESESVDMVLTSPPYDNLRTYNGYTFNFTAISGELVRVLRPGGVIVWVVNDSTVNGSETGTSLRQALHFMSLGLNLHDTMIFEKSNYFPMTHNRYEQSWEYMFVFSKGRPNTFNGLRIPTGKTSGGDLFFNRDGTKRTRNTERGLKDDKLRPNVWTYSIGQNKNGHPATFPMKLAEDHIQSWSNHGDIILDPFMGSGTTGVAAKNLGRRFIGIEISDQYFAMCQQRLGMEAIA